MAHPDVNAGRPVALLGWELGAGLGHVRPLLHLAAALDAAGLAPVLALRELSAPAAGLADCPWPVLQSPRPSPVPLPAGFVAATYADLLAAAGYADPATLWPMARAWRGLLDLVRPAVVIADHAPTLCLAARGREPVVAINAFCLPPSDPSEFPPLLPPTEATPLMPQSQVLEVVRAVQARLGQPPLATLPALFDVAAAVATVLPVLDPYDGQRRSPAVGRIGGLPAGPLPPATPPGVPPRYFAYLSATMPGCETILTTLAASGAAGRAYVRDAEPGLRRRVAAGGLEVLTDPVPMDQVLAEAAVVVHHGGAGLAHAALAAGRPQFCFPAHLEHLLTARRLHALGVAHYLTGEFPPADVREGLRQLLHEPRFADRARAVAADVARGGGHADATAIVVARAVALAPGRP